MKSKDFSYNMLLLEKARSVTDILDNGLVKKHFKLIERDAPVPKVSEALPETILENIAPENIEMPVSDCIGDLIPNL